ncbi:hypothetical protein HNQ51_000136 [Inhella inkyongensis]|uniref:Uncharacterized protein n=1 Tax=Inhella inkyongensis TaxID=392593 RepID=A0A840RZ64_9BURK|nr:hypothetical protein [Inhella inkyongensis]MBB5202843.1 hypothetical protein [Inhella inkyongensis]
MHDIEHQTEVDPIHPVYDAECLSISGRSTLTFVIGQHQDDGSLHLRIADNTGKGMWFDGWASAEAVDTIVQGATELTAKSFHALHPGRSINTGGFVLAALKELGLIRANAENTRIHEHVPTMTFEKVAGAVIHPTAAKKSKPAKTKQ